MKTEMTDGKIESDVEALVPVLMVLGIVVVCMLWAMIMTYRDIRVAEINAAASCGVSRDHP